MPRPTKTQACIEELEPALEQLKNVQEIVRRLHEAYCDDLDESLSDMSDALETTDFESSVEVLEAVLANLKGG